jgi:cytochrome c553
MKIGSLRAPLLATLLTITLAAAARDKNIDVVDLSRRELEAKIQYCKTCHGLAAEGFRGRSIIPRLAGQQAEYLENQLQAFAEHRRIDRFMPGIAKALSPAMVTALAAHFRELNPRPLPGAPAEAVAAGQRLYMEGVPSAGIPPCSSCHGPDAKGNGAIPRLAGQLHDYTSKTLTNWRNERARDSSKPDSSAVMEPIAETLTKSQIVEIAAYLSYLEEPEEHAVGSPAASARGCDQVANRGLDRRGADLPQRGTKGTRKSGRQNWHFPEGYGCGTTPPR